MSPKHPPTLMSPPSAAAGQEGKALSSLLSSIVAALQQECGALLHASLAPQGTLRIFDFLGNAILEEVQSTLASDLPGGSGGQEDTYWISVTCQ